MTRGGLCNSGNARCAGPWLESGMPTDSQTVLIALSAAVVFPLVAGWVLAQRLGRGRAAFVTATIAGVAFALWLGPKAGLLAGAWSLGLAYLATSRGFVPASLQDIAASARENRRWWG